MGGRPSGLYTTGYFEVKIGEETHASFSEASGLQVEVEMTEYREGGNNGVIHRFPGHTKFGNLVLKRGVVRKNDFYTWLKKIIDGKFEPKNVSLIMYGGPDGSKVLTWHFNNAYPVKWIGPLFQTAAPEIAIETLELVYDSMKVG
jgi:phage tail-like protein